MKRWLAIISVGCLLIVFLVSAHTQVVWGSNDALPGYTHPITFTVGSMTSLTPFPTPPPTDPYVAPCKFHGSVQINGENVPDNTVVTAVIEGYGYASVTPSIYGDSTYSILIPKPQGITYEGKTVTFEIGELTAIQIGTWRQGSNIVLNLTAESLLPCRFKGTVLVDQANPPDGTAVAAWVDGAGPWTAATYTSQGSSWYSIDVLQDDPNTTAKDGAIEGDTVFFSVDGFDAPQASTWQEGGNVRVNLSVSTSESSVKVWNLLYGLDQDPMAINMYLFPTDATQVVLADTNVPNELLVVWYYGGPSTGWRWFKPGWPESTLTTLDPGKYYIGIVTSGTEWDIPQPAQPPRPGEWIAQTEFGELRLTVSPNSTEITAMSFHFSDYKCQHSTGYIGYDGVFSIIYQTPLSIINGRFDYSTGCTIYGWLAVHGMFGGNGNYASGNWEVGTCAEFCSGIWESP